MNTAYMTEQERTDLTAILKSIDALSAAEKTIALGIMIGMRIANVSKPVEAQKGA